MQDAYSLRCSPQVHGATREVLRFARGVLETEANAVSDNPIVLPDDDEVLSGGNFHGQPVAVALDALAAAIVPLASIAERRLYRLLDPARNNGLPAFLVAESGLNSGFMLVQYTAASLVSECKTLAHPASVDSIGSSAGQEDHVSMGMTSARHVREIVGERRARGRARGARRRPGDRSAVAARTRRRDTGRSRRDPRAGARSSMRTGSSAPTSARSPSSCGRARCSTPRRRRSDSSTEVACGA